MAAIGYGARLFRGVAGATEVPDVVSITPGSPEVGMIESTHLNSPGRWKEYVSGLTDGGDCTFESRYSSASFATLFAAKGIQEVWKITFPDGLSASFPGILTKVETSLATEEVTNISGTVKVVGEMTITPAA